MFVGRFEHALDEKGRIVLPAAFRPPFEGGAVVAPWDRCLGLWTHDEFDRVAQMIKTRISEGDGDLDVMRIFFSAANTVRPDKQGRFVVPEEHRRGAGLTRDVMVAGQFDRVEIWDRQRFAAMDADKSPQLTDEIRALRL